MTARFLERIIAVSVSFMLIGGPISGYEGEQPGGATDTAPLSSNQLDALVAPIALYPDPLVAQVLAASTFPDQVAVANYWIEQHKTLGGSALMKEVNKESWDASVKALTQFPSVLDNMARNLNWTSSLGEAYHSEASEVMSAIQRLRAQAKAAGNLKSGPQVTVVQESPQVITIQAANPQIVYVPEYNPALIYGTPYVTPGYTAGDVIASSVLGFGAGVAVGSLASGGCCGWGWGSWNTNWSGGAVVYNHNNFYGNTSWHGGYYNSAQYNAARYNAAHYNASHYGYGSAYHGAAAQSRGYAARAEGWNKDDDWNHDSGLDSNSWAHADDAFRSSNAFSGFGDHSGGGWASRADSFRGWGSMRGSGFFGGRFAGGGFGGGGFRGGFGGFHRR